MTTLELKRQLADLTSKVEMLVTTSSSRLADAVTINAVPGYDAAGGTVGCLTEAVMGITAGLVRIAESITDLADAVRNAGINQGGE